MYEQERQVYEFDGFRLEAGERLLLRDGRAVTIPSKAFDLLLVLVENRGRLVEKEELYNRVWPDQIVEESNLTVQMSAIRKALGERKQNPHYIVTIPGYGYRFVGDVTNRYEDRELMVETQTVSRILIEREAEESGDVGSPTRPLPLTADAQKRTAFAARASRLRMNWMFGIVLLIALGLLIYYVPSKRVITPAGQIKSIAVLPFKPLVAGSGDESLEMGMADTLIARLSNIREINVRPISSVRKYAGLEQDALSAGREQKVDAVMDGQIQKSGEKIRVTVRLARVSDGAPLWSSQFDERMTDIFRVEDSISERVAGAMALKLSGEERGQLAKHDTDNTEAYQLYLKGRFFWNKRTGEAIRKGIDYLNQAVEKDHDYALAYAGLAESYVLLSSYSDSTPQEAFSKARAAATEALKKNDSLADVHAALAYIKAGYDWDSRGPKRNTGEL